MFLVKLVGMKNLSVNIFNCTCCVLVKFFFKLFTDKKRFMGKNEILPTVLQDHRKQEKH